MNKENRTKARKLFQELGQYEVLVSTAEHATQEKVQIRTSRTNNITLYDAELARLILEYAQGKLEGINARLEKL